jgi:RecA-family ATPase
MFPAVWVSDAALDLTVRPILKGLIDPGAFVVVYGPSGSGKSFFTADIAQHIATGAQWRGRRVTQGLVVYVASEAGSSILKRFVGWRDNRMGDAASRLPLVVLTRGPNLLDDLALMHLKGQLEQLQQEAQLPLALVVFDTLSRSIPGGDENNAEDMTKAISAADDIRGQFSQPPSTCTTAAKTQTRAPEATPASSPRPTWCWA